MLFNSVTFAIFFPVVLALYWALRTPRQQNVLLVAASMLFYGWWDWRFLLLLVGSTLVDYVCALRIDAARERGAHGKPWLVASLVANLGILGVFKYYDFFVSSAEPLWEALGFRPDLLHVVLPVGISFYTFQTLSYSIDVYRGDFRARRSYVDVAAYVMFFPQLVAGPIERASRLLPQMERRRVLSSAGIRLGVMLILTGLLKKMVLGDGVAPIVEWAFGRADLGQPVGPAEFILGNLAFVLQIYGDFSGYSDIARGAARLLGFDLMINFRQPYLSRTPGELFNRWHISLSTWLRDYLFIPLGGSRGGPLRAGSNLALTMFLAGLWHGANWTFALWGLMIGVVLVANSLLGLRNPERWSKPVQLLGIVVTVSIWGISATLFRGSNIGTSWALFQGLFTGPWSFPAWQSAAIGLGALLWLAVDLPHVFHPDEELPAATQRHWLWITAAIAAAAFWMVPPLGSEPFIYFQF